MGMETYCQDEKRNLILPLSKWQMSLKQ